MHFFHKHGRVNQEQYVTPQGTLLVALNLYIITFDIHNHMQVVFIKLFQEFKSSMNAYFVTYLICSNLRWVNSQMGNHHLDGFVSIEPLVV